MDLNLIKDSIVKHVYHIPSDANVPLHSHNDKDEIFYCLEGHGYGVLEGSEVELTPGKCFIAPANIKHSLRSDTNLYVCAFLIPVVNDRN